MTREQFSTLAVEMCSDLATDMHLRMLKTFDALTEDERDRITRGNRYPYFLVRAIGMIDGFKAVDDRFNCETIRTMITQIKKILNKRML